MRYTYAVPVARWTDDTHSGIGALRGTPGHAFVPIASRTGSIRDSLRESTVAVCMATVLRACGPTDPHVEGQQMMIITHERIGEVPFFLVAADGDIYSRPMWDFPSVLRCFLPCETVILRASTRVTVVTF